MAPEIGKFYERERNSLWELNGGPFTVGGVHLLT